jgi:hypothetical protein
MAGEQEARSLDQPPGAVEPFLQFVGGFASHVRLGLRLSWHDPVTRSLGERLRARFGLPEQRWRLSADPDACGLPRGDGGGVVVAARSQGKRLARRPVPSVRRVFITDLKFCALPPPGLCVNQISR